MDSKKNDGEDYYYVVSPIKIVIEILLTATSKVYGTVKDQKRTHTSRMGRAWHRIATLLCRCVYAEEWVLQLRSSETITEDGHDDYGWQRYRPRPTIPALRYLHDSLRRRRFYGAMRVSNAIYHFEPGAREGVQRDLLHILVRRVRWRVPNW